MSNVAGYFHGYPACSCLLEWLPAYEAELRRRKILGRLARLRIYQLIGLGSKSGGTHGGGGAFDILDLPGGEDIWVARQMGADATWSRLYNWDGKGGMAHIHGVLRGCPHNGPARYQIESRSQGVDHGRNGLASGGADTGPRPLSGRTWREGIAWASQFKAKNHRIGLWNVYLIKERANLADRVRRILHITKNMKLDVFGAVEAPTSGDGKRIEGKVIGSDGKRMKRVGAKARYLHFRSDAKIHGSASWDPWPKHKSIHKPVTSACVTLDGRKRFYVLAHPQSGNGYAAHRRAWAKAVVVKSIRRAKKQGLGREDIVFLGDFNGSEFAAVAAGYGFVRARAHATWKSPIKRTYNAWGKRKVTDAGGQLDYILVHKSKAKAVTRARTFWTPRASDHNPTLIQIKE